MKFLALLFMIPLLLENQATTGAEKLEEEEIRETVFRYLIKRHSNVDLYCLAHGIDEKGNYIDPSPLFMKRFGESPPVKTATSCIEDKSGPRLAAAAIVLTIQELRQNGETAMVRVQHFRNVQNAGAGVCKVTKSRLGMWEVSGFKSVMISRVDE